jgi:hypothetical protein
LEGRNPKTLQRRKAMRRMVTLFSVMFVAPALCLAGGDEEIE